MDMRPEPFEPPAPIPRTASSVGVPSSVSRALEIRSAAVTSAAALMPLAVSTVRTSPA